MMQNKRQWDVREFDCPEEKRTASLVIEWDESGGRPVLKSICCDNPKFYGLDNWDCGWSCWDELAGPK